MPTTSTGLNGPLAGLCPETARGDGEAKRVTDKAGQILNDKPLQGFGVVASRPVCGRVGLR